MTEGTSALVRSEDLDQSLLRLYNALGRADTYGDIVAALRPEIKRMLGYDSIWLQLLREDTHDLLMLDAGGTVEASLKAIIQDERFRLTMHGEDFVLIPVGDDPWLNGILGCDGVYVTEDSRTHPDTNKDIVAVTGMRSVVSVLLTMAERTTGSLSMGTFFDEGVLVPTEVQIDYLRRLSNHVAVAADRVRFLGERLDAEAALKQTVEQLRFSSFLLDSVMDGVIVRDAEDWHVLYVNDAMCRLAGMTAEEVLASREPDWARPEDRDAVMRHLESLHTPGTGEMEAVTGANGREVQLRSSAVEYLGRKAILSVVSDVSERRAAQATIEHMALHDPLTDLANRALLKDRLELALAHARRSAKPLALMFLDVDNFKVINDTAGHGTGDLLLQEIGMRLRRIVRADDTVARFGGDEFTLVLPDVDSVSAAERVAEKILESFREPFETGAMPLTASASIGVAMYDCGDTTVNELLRNADLAMYCAKDAGRDTYRVFDETMNERAVERFVLKRDLQRAIAEGELALHFQPIVRLADGAVVGAEALCRWTHPERGPIPPGTFVPLAEETGAICELGEWVMGEACRQAAAWQQPGNPLTVWVNLSARQLWDCDLSMVVRGALRDSGLPPELLQLEITESMAMRDAPYLIGAFGTLREMGVRIAIDDFGTGYSSLDYLMRFPVDTLKVDRAFVRDMCDDSRCLAIATAVVSLAQALGLETVAEGVETEEQRQALTAAACPYGQGFLFSPGVGAEEFQRLILERPPSAV